MVLLYTDLGCQGLHILCSIMLLDASCAEDGKQILPKAILMLGTLFTLRVLSQLGDRVNAQLESVPIWFQIY